MKKPRWEEHEKTPKDTCLAKILQFNVLLYSSKQNLCFLTFPSLLPKQKTKTKTKNIATDAKQVTSLFTIYNIIHQVPPPFFLRLVNISKP